MSEYRFEYQPAVPSGRVVFQVVNVGRVDHKLSLLPLAEDFPPIDAQLHGPERVVMSPFADVPLRPPGATGTFAVDLEPGRRYAFICFLRDPDGQPHALKGMNSEFRASGTLQEEQEDEADEPLQPVPESQP